jgi:hypothetical protein
MVYAYHLWFSSLRRLTRGYGARISRVVHTFSVVLSLFLANSHHMVLSQHRVHTAILVLSSGDGLLISLDTLMSHGWYSSLTWFTHQ